jgi:hypothetical protein
MASLRSNRLVALVLGVTFGGLTLPAYAIDFVTAVPEPGTMALVLGAVGGAVLVWRRNRKK